MGRVIAGMTTSLDGFVADADGQVDRLYADLAELLWAGLVDELHLDVMPVLLGGGLRLLEHLDPDRIRLETLGVDAVGQRTSLRYRVVR